MGTTTRVAVYDSAEVQLIFAGIPIEDGRAENDFITIDAEGDAFGVLKGAGRHICRYATHEVRYLATVRLLGSSMHNETLSTLHALDASSPGGAGVGAFLVKDLNGASLYTSPYSWIRKGPAKGFGMQPADVEWAIQVIADPALMLAGGN